MTLPRLPWRSILIGAVAAALFAAGWLGNGWRAGDPILLLADVLGRADQRAGDLAQYADAARVAGQKCERDYDALISTTP